MAEGQASVSKSVSFDEIDHRLLPLIEERECAADGMAMLVDCRFDEAAALFAADRETHPSMALGYCLTLVLRAITSFEDDHKKEAIDALKTVQHDCHHERGRFRSILHECLGARSSSPPPTDSGKTRKHSTPESGSLHNAIARYHVDLVLADCYLCSAVITMMNMDWASYARGGWIVRKSWKLYEKLYREAKRLNDSLPRELRKSASKSSASFDDSSMEQSFSSPTNGSFRRTSESKAIARLYTAVCFGFGLFNLLLSILSPQVLKVISFLGFSSSRRTGLDCLAYASRSDGMRAALATLSLLWFDTVARPFFALDISAIDAGVEGARKLMSSHYSRRLVNTMLFVFFQGRIRRLQSDIFGAIDHYFKALHAAGEQKELMQMCQYELGWCYLHLKDWRLALPYFNELKETSKWAPSYYSYMVALCYGACGDLPSALAYFTEATKTVKNKKSPLEAFVLRRAKKTLKNRSAVTQDECYLFTLEIMYIWRALLNVPQDAAEKMVADCRNMNDSRWLLPLKCLLEGVLCARLDHLEEETEQCFRECIARCDNRDQKDEKHWLAFATYELGYMLMKKQETRGEAKTLLAEARDKFHGCDFDNRLSMRVFAALKWIEKSELEEQQAGPTGTG